MKKIIFLVLIGFLGVVFFIKKDAPPFSKHALGESVKGAKYFCPMHPNYVSDEPGDCPICQMRLVPLKENKPASAKRKILFYRHPMKPEISSPVPAKDQMGMDYIPVYDDEVSPKTTGDICVIHECPMLKKGESCPMLVVAEKGEKVECPICKQKIAQNAGLSANAPVEGYAAVLMSPEKRQLIGIQTGRVEKKTLAKTIRTVGKIARDPELYQAEAEYIQSLESLKNSNEWARKLVESAKVKLTLLGLSPAMIEELEKQSAPDKSLLYAVPGGEAWVYANIYEYEMPLVKVGDEIAVEMPSMPGKPLKGLIRAIDSVVDPATRSVRVRATIPNADGSLKPDMYVNVSLKASLGEVITVPEEAVFSTGTSNIVFVEKAEGLFDPRPVTLGPKAEHVYVVTDGLKEGERVVTNGNFLLDSESRLRAALSGAHG